MFPRLVAAEHHAEFTRAPASSGVAELDVLLGGGLDRGTTALLMGPAGSGKSSLALQYVATFAEEGQKALLYTFDETLALMLARARALGLRLEEPIQDGRVVARQVDPAELSPGEFAGRVRRGVEAGARLVVIDSLNGYMNAMPGERYLSNQLHELAAYLNQQGVLTLVILAQHGLVSISEAPVDLSYLADTVLLLRYFEVAGEVKQAVAVIKKRSGRHEKTIREFKIEDGKGIRVGAPLQEFQGILGGAAVYLGGAGGMMK